MLFIQIGIAVYCLILIWTIVRIFVNVKNPSKTLLWLLVVIFIPFIGMIMFRIIGRSTKRDAYFTKRQPFYNTSTNSISDNMKTHPKHRLIELLNKNTSAAFSNNNIVEIHTDGFKAFDVLFKILKQAKYSIHLEFYIIESGKNLDTIIAILEKKIKEGVAVRIIYDGIGSSDLSSSYLSKLKSIGASLQVYMPYFFNHKLKYINYRNHRKIVLIDNEVALVGGMNISDKYITYDNKEGLWKDTLVKINGPSAQDIEHVFNCDWLNAGGERYTLQNNSINKPEKGCPVQIVSGGPGSEYMGILHEYFTIITDAQEYIYLTTPYFVPTNTIMTALKTSALSGIDVRVMLPYNSDYRWLKWCTFSFVEELLAAGVRIYLYHDGFLHGKVMISDDMIASVGSANVDERSFTSNFEINAIVYDEKTTIQLKHEFYNNIAFSEELTLADFKNRSDRNKVIESIARLTSPIL